MFVKDIPCFTKRVFEIFKNAALPALLEGNLPQSRYSIFTAMPYLTLTTLGYKTIISDLVGQQESTAEPFELIKTYLNKKSISHSLPFPGGAIGYFSYDLARRYEKLPSIAQHDITIPDMLVAFYDWALIIDHQLQQAQLVRHPEPELPDEQWQEIVTKIESLVTIPVEFQSSETFQIQSPFISNLTQADYQAAFSRIQDYILAGDCYQVNLAQRFTAAVSGSPWAAYYRLSQQIQAPFSAFLQYDDFSILSMSPERFLKVCDGKVETKPIKGTRPRHANPHVDEQLAKELSQSAKDQAENLMIVDLMRNDLSKVCKPGSVKVPQLFGLETFTTVHHLVSTITGELMDGKHAVDILQACFPGGSVTGAPKIRSMEIIEELEPHRRSVYCGSIGYIGFNGSMDTNIAIRTLIWTKAKLHCYAGGAIVADSKVDEEYQETLTKIERILRILQISSS
ncbi:MAG: pabB [Gammaproteobacteria bacterium]|jgi:para-aminobenzoate synthetase component 1|nr:pabB [Gammaproteobacteria bacterium]